MSDRMRKVRVSYEPRGFGVALALSDTGEHLNDGAEAHPEEQSAGPDQDGVLRIGDACVTLELPTSDGRVSMLAWDPAEVPWASIGLAAAG